jgi:hypothetical protein
LPPEEALVGVVGIESLNGEENGDDVNNAESDRPPDAPA